MIYFDSESNPKFISAEEGLSQEELQSVEIFFAPIAQDMSALLGKSVKAQLQFTVNNLSGWDDKRVRVYFYIESDDSKKTVAEINWRLQNSLKPDIMEDGVIDIFIDELRGHDFGYRMFLAKREIGKKLGYQQILLNSLRGKGGYPEYVIAKEEEKKYGWRKMSPQGDDSYIGHTYIGNISPE